MRRLSERTKRTISQIVAVSIIASFFVAVPVAYASVEWDCSIDNCSNIIGLYHFNIAGGTAADSSGNNHNGTNTNITTIAGQFGNAYSFSGSSSVFVPRVLSLSAFGISLWVKTTDGNRGIFQESVSSTIPQESASNRQLIFNGGRVCARVYNNETICTPGSSNYINYADGSWHHIVHTFGPGVPQRLYLDNVLKTTGTKTSAQTGGGGGFWIGWADDAPSPSYHYFVGSIDEVAVYDRALTATDVANLYSAGFQDAYQEPTSAFTTALTYVSDTLSDSNIGVAAVHTVGWISSKTVGAGEFMRISADPSGLAFNLSSLLSSDILATGMTLVSSCTAASSEARASIDTAHDAITLTVCPGDTVSAGAKTVIIGGTNKITNPSSAGSYIIRIRSGSDGTNDQQSDTRVAVIGNVNVTASMATSFTFNVAAKTSGTVNGDGTSCDAGTTDTAIFFGTLTAGVPKVACQTLSVTTNAKNGFVVTIKQDQSLTSANGATINTFKDGSANATPAAWLAPTENIDNNATWGHMGVTSDDSDLNGGEFNSDKYAGNILSARPVFSHTGPANGTTANKGQADVAYKVEISSLQEAADDYSATLTYVATPSF